MTAPVDSNAPLHALLANYPQYQGLLRDGAAKHFVVVSNADRGLPAASFLEQVAALNPGFPEGFTFHSFVATSEEETRDPDPLDGIPASASEVGDEYLALSAGTGSFVRSVCVLDDGSLALTSLSDLAFAIDLASQ